MRRIARLESSLDAALIVMFVAFILNSTYETGNEERLYFFLVLVFILDILITCVHGALEVYQENK